MKISVGHAKCSRNRNEESKKQKIFNSAMKLTKRQQHKIKRKMKKKSLKRNCFKKKQIFEMLRCHSAFNFVKRSFRAVWLRWLTTPFFAAGINLCFVLRYDSFLFSSSFSSTLLAFFLSKHAQFACTINLLTLNISQIVDRVSFIWMKQIP